jgi:putative ABC transport system permease protein
MISGSDNNMIAVIGDQLASKNNLKVGSTFTLYGKTIIIGGILSSETSSSKSDSPMGRDSSVGTAIILPLATVQSLTNQSGQINKIIVTVDNINNVNSVSSKITSIFGDDSNGNSTVSVHSQQSNVEAIINNFNEQKTAISSVGITALISLISCSSAAAVIVLLTMLMVVRERRNEIGVLKAIGAKTRVIVAQFIVESLVLTLLASAIGLFIGIAIATPLTSTLVSSATSSSSNIATESMGRSVPDGQSRGVGKIASQTGKAIGNVTASIDWTIVLDAVGSAVVIAAVGATGASLAAVRIKPAEAIRAE